MSVSPYSLAELMIVAASRAWAKDGEVMATGIGPLPRLAAGLCKLTENPLLAMTDGECWYTSEPLPLGVSSEEREVEGWSPYDRVFSGLWGGKRNVMVAPVQIDRFGQTNISVIGDHSRPKAAMLGARGFPGNSICHPNSFFFTSHSKRSFVTGEVDFVCSAGYNPDRYPGGRVLSGVDLQIIVTDLAVLDFGGPHHAIRVVSLHPGIGFDQVQDNTDFELSRLDDLPLTPAPTAEQLALIDRLDPKGQRRKVLKDDPAGDRR
ncbi:MAG: ketoacid CoA transferase [Sphingomonadales bacterium]|nr:MAG: ketoacid CoA transferase [Sphingomonadales bacterium]